VESSTSIHYYVRIIWNQGTASITTGGGAWYDGTNYALNMNSGDNVTFGGGTVGAAGTISLGNSITPGKIAFISANGGSSYTIGASITDPPITMSGGLITNSASSGPLFNCAINGSFTIGSSASSIKLANDSSQSAADTVTITKGAIQIGNNGTTGGLGAAVVTNNGSLTWKQSGTINMFNAIYGTGTLKLWGNGATFLLWSNMYYSGSTTLQPTTATVPASLVQLWGNNVLPTNTALSILQNSTTPSGAQILDLNGYSQTVGSLSGDQYASAATEVITNSSVTPSVLTLGGASMTSSFGGLIGGNLSLVLNGIGSTLTLTNVANNFIGNTLINAGTLKITGFGGLASTRNIAVNSGTLQINGSSVLGGGSYSGNITNNGSVLFNSSMDQILTGTVSGSGTLAQSGSGLLQLNGTNSYSGSTTVSGGKLLVNGSLGTTVVTVTNGGTLFGSGVLRGATTIKLGGTLIPGLGGTDTSSLTISNNLNLAGNVIFSLNRNYSPSSASVDGINALTYGGSLTVSNLGGALQSGDVFQLFQANNYAGKFNNWILPTLVSGLAWNTNGLTNGYISVTGTTTLPTVGITASNITKTFGQSLAFAGTEFFAGNLPNDVTVTNVTLSSAGAANNAAVGVYAIVPGNAQGAGLTNCNLVYTNGVMTVTPAVPVLTVTSGGSPTVYGDSVALTARVSPVQAAGMVQFLINGVLFDTEALAGGVAISALNTSMPVGTNQLASVFIPSDGNVLPATNSLQQVVLAAASQTNGLTAQYFNDTGFTSLNTSLLDSNGINENWSNAVPPGTTLTNGRPFAVRWSGQVVPGYSETYTFYVTASSGARLWVNDHLLLNSLSPVPPGVEMSGSISLVGGMRYNIHLEYLSSGSNSSVQLNWSSPSTPKQVLPASSCVAVTDPHERGSILTEIWQNLPGTNVTTLTSYTNYPNQPNMRDTHFAFECIATNWGTNYGEKVSGYIEPLLSGYYTFSVAASDTAELWLSTNVSSANKVLLLAVTNATGYHQFTNLAAPIRLAAWQKYYVELLHKAGAGGNDHYSVAWLAPGQTTLSVISSDNLVPNYLDQTNLSMVATYMTNHLSQSHPRLQISAERFAWLKSTLDSGAIPDLNAWWQVISNSAVALLTTPVVTTNDDQYYGCRAMDSRMKILGLAYRITGDTNFAECAWLNLQQVASSNYPADWFASIKFLDTADMTRGVAIGYDWFYDYWTSNRLNIIATAMQVRGLNQWYAHSYYADNNPNIVHNSGIAAGVLALGMDPGIGSFSYKTNQILLSNAVASVSRTITHYSADNGAWYESPGYWDYATRNLIPMIASLQTALGTDFGLSGTPALGETGNFAMGIMGNVQPSNLNFGYGDTGFGIQGGMPMFWLARRYNRPEYAAYERDSGHLADASNGLSFLDIVWYDWRGSDPVSGQILPDNYYRGLTGTTTNSPANIITLRSDWGDPNATAVLFKTGANWNTAHNQLDGGSFMLDARGVRWAQDFGTDDYNLPGYFANATNGQRWTYYRLRAEGHNTLVVNPGTNADQTVGSAPPMLLYASHPDGDNSYAVADLTSAYNITKAWRGVKLFNNRRWFLVQDELQAATPATVWWFMHITTSMNPIISSSGQSVLLTQGTGQLWLTNLTGVGSFVISNAVPLPTSPNPAGQDPNIGYEKLAIKLTGVTNTTLAILMVPLTVGQSVSPTDLPAVVPLTNWPAMDVSQPPILSAISNSTIIAGATLLVTNQANDPNLPPQPLVFSLAVAPTGATINSNSGVIFWRPTISQAGLAYPFTVAVSETGGSQLSATQSFKVTVTSPVKPVLTTAGLAGGQFQIRVNGDYGPDYTVTVSTNLVSWASIFTTNSPVLPFLWSEPVSNSFAQRFYRIILGP
jgi:autotransporter-associated beta strand protein